MLSTSCADRPKPQSTQMIYVLPPAVLLQQCDDAPFTGTTFGDAVTALHAKQGEMKVCASRMEALIKWAQSAGRE
ncbi:Rz1-like lysis system protein LysC [Serratia marcescens]|uniref:Rz1-like lysis system protein LysC n=2 Tax=Serratia marcescens TaxID=615 RepID=UPI003D1639F9